MKAKHKMQRKQPAASPPRAAVAGSGKRWLVLALAVAFSAGGVWAFCEFVVWNRLPSELVGKWVVTDGPQEGATFDFFRNGTMVGKIDVQGREGIIDASVRVEGNKLYSTTTHPQSGRADTRVQTIRTLTATALVVEDDRGQVMKMERAN
jgi:uncharacterized protein (TIGR03066 family)